MYTLEAIWTQSGTKKFCTELDNSDFVATLEESKDGIKLVLTAKRTIELHTLKLNTKYNYKKNEWFLVNGYQSWSTTQEMKAGDLMPGINQTLSRLDFGKYMMSAYGDYNFTSYGEKSVFHSFTFTYLRPSGSHFIKLFGSRMEKNGFTFFEADMNQDTFSICKDVEGLTLQVGQRYEAIDVAFIEDEYDAAFDKYFFNFCGFQKPSVTRETGYTSWYNYFQNINEEIILRDLEGLDRVQDQVSIFQIDDGFEPAVGDWLVPDEKKFPRGMAYVVDRIHEKGYKAGLWLAPFSAQKDSKLAKQHPDWLVRNSKGKKLMGNWSWGGAYSLDIYNPAVRAYLKKVFDTVFEDWGFDMVKLDFLYSICIEPRDGKTRGELMADGVALLRELCGNKIILGCGVPLGSCMGIFDACRIGPDANKVYSGTILNKVTLNNEVPSSRNAMTNSIFRRCLNGRAFANDPDVFFLRDENCKYTSAQKLLLGKINDITGSILFVSDNATDYGKFALDAIQKIFAEKSYKVLLAEFTGANTMKIEFTEDGRKKTLRLNFKNGKSNVKEIL